MSPDWDVEIQQLQIEEAVRDRPDMIIIIPENTDLSSHWYRDINSSGIPVIASNLMPDDEGFKYILLWTGPDDWGQFRKLAVEFANRMDSKGCYCVVGHIPGTSAYYARRLAIITELNRIAPAMKLLSMESTNLDICNTYLVVRKWLNEFGNLVQIGIRMLKEGNLDAVTYPLRRA